MEFWCDQCQSSDKPWRLIPTWLDLVNWRVAEGERKEHAKWAEKFTHYLAVVSPGGKRELGERSRLMSVSLPYYPDEEGKAFSIGRYFSIGYILRVDRNR